MISPISFVLSVIAIILFIKTFHGYSKKDLEMGELVLWGTAWLSLLVLALNPGISSYFAKALGVERGTDLIVYLSIIALFYLVYAIYKRVDKQDKEITRLVRELAKKKK